MGWCDGQWGQGEGGEGQSGQATGLHRARNGAVPWPWSGGAHCRCRLRSVSLGYAKHARRLGSALGVQPLPAKRTPRLGPGRSLARVSSCLDPRRGPGPARPPRSPGACLAGRRARRPQVTRLPVRLPSLRGLRFLFLLAAFRSVIGPRYGNRGERGLPNPLPSPPPPPPPFFLPHCTSPALYTRRRGTGRSFEGSGGRPNALRWRRGGGGRRMGVRGRGRVWGCS